MYYQVMNKRGEQINLKRVIQEMDRQGLDSKRLAALAGVSEATVSKLLNGKSPGMSAVNLASIASVLRVSVDYLLGLTNDPLPKSLAREELIVELARVAQELTNRRRHDLLMMARAYLEASREMRGNPRRLTADLLDMIEEAGGNNSRRLLVDLLRDDQWTDDDLSNGGVSPDNGDEPVDDKD